MNNKTITIDKKLYDKLISNEKEIEKSLHLNETLLDAIPHPAMLIDKHRIVLAANEKARDMGAQVGGLCYEGFSTCRDICKSQGNCCFCNRELDIDQMDSKNIEIEAYDNVWDTWWVPVDKSSFLHYSVDITNIRRGEQILIESAKELESSNKELEQFAYIASHDLQEPLRVVSTYCQLIEILADKIYFRSLNKQEKEELHQYITFTTDATNRMRFLIKDLLEFSRVGMSDDDYEMIDINDVIKNTIKDFEIAIQDNDAIIEHASMPTIMGKRRRISQVFHNIVSNAMKFKSDRDVVISIGAEERKNDWLFSISDTGIGIVEDQQERVFGIFKRLHSREDYPGTGIGLALVKKIVENHGGKVWIESIVGEGSTFYFTIPKSWEMIKTIK
jgi:light-regulated signal transduction histidine kinase (bacteriophytochrome)